MNKIIYMDNAATTPVRPEVLAEMLPYFTDCYGNASSVYKLGQQSKKALEDARENIAALIGADKKELYFTSCGTESDNWAIRASAYKLADKGRHIITSAIEHPAVLNVCKQLEKEGFTVTYLPVDKEGLVSPQSLEDAMTDGTTLVSIMWANNEVGTIQPIAELAETAHRHGAVFHTDAVQAMGILPIDVKKVGVDMLSFSGHKFNAPKGIGGLYVSQKQKIDGILKGGHQESGRRPGTENIAYIVGMAKALELAVNEREEKTARLIELRDYIIDRLLKEIPDSFLNGHRTKRLPGNINVSFRYIEGEGMLLLLDSKGIAVSSGSACTSGSLDPSHVLLAMGLKHEEAHGSVRISLSGENTKEEADFLVDSLKMIVERLRMMSPLYMQKAH